MSATLSDQDNITEPLDTESLCRVLLPFPGKYIWQDNTAQPVSDAVDMLQNLICDQEREPGLCVLELGSGCGIISLMLSIRNPGWKVLGLEIQPRLWQIARFNASLVQSTARFLLQDIRTFSTGQKYDLIVANPPWQKAGTGILSPNAARNQSRHELTCTMEDVLSCIQDCLAEAGRAWIIYPRGRDGDMQKALAKTELDIKANFFVPEPQRYVIYLLQRKM